MALREVVARDCGLEPTQVFVGNGSDEVLSHVFQGLLKQPRELLFPDITYSFYPVWCQLHGISYRQVPLREDFSIDPEDYSRAAAAVIFPNPNAPTGRLLETDDLRRFLTASASRLVVVDEAYINFGGRSAVSLLDEFDNLLVVQTLSKARALAGLRVGLAFGAPSLIEALVRVKDSFNSYPLDVIAQRAAQAAYEDSAWFAARWEEVAATRARFAAELAELGFEVLPSAANFVFLRHPRWRGEAIFAALRERAILVRRWSKPRIEDWLRVTIGTPSQMERVTTALRECLADLAA